jgi:hypothetical protein
LFVKVELLEAVHGFKVQISEMFPEQKPMKKKLLKTSIQSHPIPSNPFILCQKFDLSLPVDPGNRPWHPWDWRFGLHLRWLFWIYIKNRSKTGDFSKLSSKNWDLQKKNLCLNNKHVDFSNKNLDPKNEKAVLIWGCRKIGRNLYTFGRADIKQSLSKK